MAKTFTVNSKDLFDKEKNPTLSISARDIERNPNIPKKYIGKWIFEHHQSPGVIGLKEATGEDLAYILRERNLVHRFAQQQDELTDLTADDIFLHGDYLYNKNAVVIAFSDSYDHMDYMVGLREGEQRIRRTHSSFPHRNPFEISNADLEACLQKPDKIAYDCIMEKKKDTHKLWD